MDAGRLAAERSARGGVGASALQRFGPEAAQLLVVAMWASTFIVTKAVFAEIAPLAFTFVRFALLAAFAVGVLAVRRGPWMVRRADLPRFALAGLTGYTFYQLGFVLGLARTSPFSSSLLIAMVPLLTVVLLALGGERPGRRVVLGLAIALLGAAIFLADKRDAPGTLLGDALSLGAAVSFAIYGIVARPLVRDYPPETYAAYTILAGSAPLLLISGPAALAQDWGAVSALGWVACVYMAVLPVYVAYILWNWAIARRGVAAASSLGLLVPIASGVLSAFIFAEGFGPLKLLGAALVLTGLIVLRTKRVAGHGSKG